MKEEFKSFGEIKRLTKIEFSITQKLHGTNAQVYIFPAFTYLECISFEEANKEAFIESYLQKYPEYSSIKLMQNAGDINAVGVFGESLDLVCGSRTRWIYPGDDNFGFAAFVHAHKQEFIEKLGPGKHFGEWCGPGINSGEGFKEKTFVLFNWNREYPNGLPPQTVIVPVLVADAYHGDRGLWQTVDDTMKDLKENGSKAVPGFMRPEGVVVTVAGARYKKVFEAEETQWKKPSKEKIDRSNEPKPDYSALLQPIRLEKLLSRDERYIREYPKSLGDIVKDYVADLIKENQIVGDEDQVKAIKKGASGDIFKFVKTVMTEKNIA